MRRTLLVIAVAVLGSSSLAQTTTPAAPGAGDGQPAPVSYLTGVRFAAAGARPPEGERGRQANAASDQALAAVAKSVVPDGRRCGASEFLVWAGDAAAPAGGVRALRERTAGQLKAFGYAYRTVFDSPDGALVLRVFQLASQRQDVLGFWVEGPGFLTLSWCRLEGGAMP